MIPSLLWESESMAVFHLQGRWWETADLCVVCCCDGGIVFESRAGGCKASCPFCFRFRSSPDAEQLEETPLGDEDSACFSPPPYEEICSPPR